MVLKHNKKRNVGLVYEFFSRYIGNAIIEGRDHDVQRARELIRKHFNKDTDLSKELKLFRTLYEAKVENREMALHLLNRVRESVRYQSQARLDLEKSALIQEVTTQLKDEKFFDQNIPNYKMLATTQMVLNNWRNESLLRESVGEVVQLEEQIIQHLVSSPPASVKATISNATEMTDTDVDRLVVNLMTEKVNTKFGDNLSSEQKKIIQLYVFEKDHPTHGIQLTTILESMKDRVLKAIGSAKTEFVKDKVLTDKIGQVQQMLVEDYGNVSNHNDDLISFYLGLPTLEKELSTPDETA